MFRTSPRRSFTIVELLIVISLIGVLAASLLSALYTVGEDAKEARTRAQIMKLHELIMEQWDSYLTRPLQMISISGLPLSPEPFVDANQDGVWESGEAYTDRNGNNSYDRECIAFFRQLALHDLMRMELPDRITDLTHAPISPLLFAGVNWGRQVPPAKWLSFRRKAGIVGTGTPGSAPAAAPAAWSIEYQGAECLYLIVSQISDGDSKALDFFLPEEIGDVDEDGYKEILDAWGRPISFIRWPAGFATLPGPDGAFGVVGVDDDGNGTVDDLDELGWPGSDDRTELMGRVPATSPDPMNPFGAAPAGFALFPLIYSAGRDGLYEITSEFPSSPVQYAPLPANLPPAPRNFPNDPYLLLPNGVQIGKPAFGGGDYGFLDNITNHSILTNAG